MRDILFRGKRTDNGEWVEGYLLQNYDREKWLEAVDIPVEPGKHRRFV